MYRAVTYTHKHSLSVGFASYTSTRAHPIYNLSWYLRTSPTQRQELPASLYGIAHRGYCKEPPKQTNTSQTIPSHPTPPDSKHPIVESSKKEDQNTSQYLKTKAANLWVFLKDGAKHYWLGTKLLFKNFAVASHLLWKILKPKNPSEERGLSRRERALLVQTFADLLKLGPFIIIVVVPFMELSLPILLKLFPGMLPSTFEDKEQKEMKRSTQLKAKMEMAKFLQDATEALMAPSAQEFQQFMTKVKSGEPIANEEMVKFSQVFREFFSIENLSREHLIAMAKYMSISVPLGGSIQSTEFLRKRLVKKFEHLQNDDRMILKEGLESLSIEELADACFARGMRVEGLNRQQLITQMREWLDLSLNQNLPPAMLVLSRAFNITRGTKARPAQAQPVVAPATAIGGLPESIVQTIAKELPEAKLEERLAKLSQQQQEILAEEKKLEEKKKQLESEKKKLEAEKKQEEERKKQQEEKKKAEEVPTPSAAPTTTPSAPSPAPPTPAKPVQPPPTPASAPSAPVVEAVKHAEDHADLEPQPADHEGVIVADTITPMVEKVEKQPQTTEGIKEELEDLKEEHEKLSEQVEGKKMSPAATKLAQRVENILKQIDKEVTQLEKEPSPPAPSPPTITPPATTTPATPAAPSTTAAQPAAPTTPSTPPSTTPSSGIPAVSAPTSPHAAQVPETATTAPTVTTNTTDTDNAPPPTSK